MKRPVEKGAALIITLWALVLLAVLAASFSFAIRYESAGTRNFKDDARAYYMAVSAYEEAVNWILGDQDQAVDYVGSEGVLLTDEERESITGVREMDGGTLELTIKDEQSRININTISLQQLKNLFVHTGIPDTVHQELIDSFLDWTDPDDLHHFAGAEDNFYEPSGYKPKNSLLTTPEELLLVKGFKPEYLYGDDEILPLLDYITTWGEGLNINSMDANLMEAIGLDPLQVDALMTSRRNDMFYRGVPQGFQSLRGTIASSYFRITANARIQDSPTSVKIIAVIHRTFGANGAEVETVYWKESIEYSGTEHKGV